jgi:hypothetical protein
MTFNKWLDTLIEEKGIDTEELFEVDGPSGTNIMPALVVIEAIKSTSKQEQAAIKTTLVKIDFCNGDIMHYFKHLAGALAI